MNIVTIDPNRKVSTEKMPPKQFLLPSQSLEQNQYLLNQANSGPFSSTQQPVIQVSVNTVVKVTNQGDGRLVKKNNGSVYPHLASAPVTPRKSSQKHQEDRLSQRMTQRRQTTGSSID